MSLKNFSSFENLNSLFTYLGNLYKSRFSGSEKLIRDTVGWTSKNQLQIPNSVVTDEINGVTFTVNRNANGEVTSVNIDGTASVNTDFVLKNHFYPQEKVILSGCTSGAADTYKLQLWDSTSGDGFNCYTTDVAIDRVNHDCLVQIVVYSGQTVSNVNLYPMIRSATNDDSTFEAYHDSVDDVKYGVGDTAETAIANDDYVPFYDTSATAKRKSTWSNIKSVLKTYFDTLYNAVSVSTNGTASTTTVRKQVITIDNVTYDVDGSVYMQDAKQTTPGTPPVFTFTNAVIVDGCVVDVCSSEWGLGPETVVTTPVSGGAGTCVVTFPDLAEAITLGCRIYIR